MMPIVDVINANPVSFRFLRVGNYARFRIVVIMLILFSVIMEVDAIVNVAINGKVRTVHCVPRDTTRQKIVVFAKNRNSNSRIRNVLFNVTKFLVASCLLQCMETIERKLTINTDVNVTAHLLQQQQQQQRRLLGRHHHHLLQ